MNNSRFIIFLLLIYITHNSFCMKKHSKNILGADWTTLPVEKKLRLRQFLLKDIAKIRDIKKQAKIRQAKFNEAILKGDMTSVQLLFNDDCARLIDVNKPIAYRVYGQINNLYPIRVAALKVTNISLVKFLLEKGARAAFSDGSLIYHILIMLNEDAVFWSTSDIYREYTAKIRKNYLSNLEHIFAYLKFKKAEDEDSKKCVDLWLKIITKVTRYERFIETEAIQAFKNITKEFFSDQ